MNWIYQPWPWYVSGPLISLSMFALMYLGKRFGMSTNLKTLCTIGGAGKTSDFFKTNWKEESWNLLVLVGAIVGGFIGAHYLSDGQVPDLNPKTIEKLQGLGFASAGKEYLPTELYGINTFSNFKTSFLLILGGVLVGFGARYAGGCTSGHSISGLSNLQWPSLFATIGFFIGGLVMVHLIFPLIF